MKKFNIVVAVVSLVFGVLVLYLSRNLSGYDEHGVPGENYWPSIIAWLLIVLGALQFVELWLTPKANAKRQVDLCSPAVRMAFIAAAASAVYGVLLLFSGFEIATLIFIPCLMALMGERRVVSLMLTPIAVVATIHVFFTQVFNTTLPVSMFYE